MSSPLPRRQQCVVDRQARGIVAVVAGGRELGRFPLLDAPTDLELVGRLARAQLAARRAGGSIRLVVGCPQLVALLDLCGLGVEVGRQPEGGEQLGLDEGVEPGDPPC